MDKIAIVFSGQGAQYPGMGRDIYEKYPEARKILDAFERLHPGLLHLMFESDAEELRKIVPEPIELPDIDFAKYSLIVGQHVFEEPRYSLESQAVETGTDVLTLNLVYRVLDGAAPAAIAPYYFWGIYDKLPEYEVNVNITTF